MVDVLMVFLKLVIMVVVPVATSVLTFLLKTYLEELINKNVQNETADALKKGLNIILDSVNYVQQTYVDNLKKEDKFTAEAQSKALQSAKQRAIELMNTDVQSAIEASYGNLDTYVTTVIESLIKKNK
ncbi:phage holin, LLH family [Megamonas funiformis]|jgi:hypothetical protein|uniref:phage holin, LLH family n=1 Tax=Megamonas funiformis TaxID=437897 RepID=UPI003F869B46